MTSLRMRRIALALLLSMIIIRTVDIRAEPLATAPKPAVPVYIEDSPAAQELADKVILMADQDRPTDAVEILHKITQRYTRKLMRLDENHYTDAVLWVRARLLNDPQMLKVYRRLYEPQAERQLNLARRGPTDGATLEQILLQFALTRTGLVVALDLAAHYLERAEPNHAASVLDEIRFHPDLVEFKQRYHTLQALAGLLGISASRLDEHRSQLVAMGLQTVAASVDALADRLHPPHRLGNKPDNPLTIKTLPPDDSTALWEMPIDTPRRTNTNRPRTRLPGRYSAAARLPSTLAVPHGRELYVNDGVRIHAMDRSSGRLLWIHDALANPDPTTRAAMIPSGRLIQDLRGVLIHEGRAVGILGHASPWPRRMGPNRMTTSLRCLDRKTGQLQWQITPPDLHSNLERTYFFGTPIAGESMVYALAIRHQMSRFQDAFVVAIDATTGQEVWRRHLSSTVGPNQYTAGPPPQLIIAGDRIFACDQSGAATAIDARTGAFLWLRLLANLHRDEDSTAPLGSINPLPHGPPILVEAGLLISPSNAQVPLLLLDPQTGQLKRMLNGTPLAEMSGFWSAGHDVFAINNQRAMLFDGRTLEPKWSQAVAGLNIAVPYGAVTITGDLVLISTTQRIEARRLSDGSLVRKITTASGGNIAASEGQIVHVTDGKLKSYIAWDHAHKDLLEQMQRLPESPEPGLALAHLGLLHGRDSAVLDGTDHAMAAVQQIADQTAEAENPIQHRLFDQLIAFTDPGRSGVTTPLRRALFDRIGTAAASPEQEVAYHLAFGQFLEQIGQLDQTVQHYQAVLLDPGLNSQLYSHRNVFRQAGLEARSRLRDLIRRHGRSVYAPFDQLATQQLSALTAQNPVVPEALVRLAAQYPLAQIAPEALYNAGKILASAGDTKAASRQLRRAYHLATEPDLLAQITGRLVLTYQNGGQPNRATRWLRRISREHPGLNPVRDRRPIPVESWLKELTTHAKPTHELSRLTLPTGPARMVTGRLMTTNSQSIVPMTRDRFLTYQQGQVQAHVLTATDPAWTVDLAGDDLMLLMLSDDQALFWSEQLATLSALDPATGNPLWPAIAAASLLQEVGDTQRRNRHRPLEQRQFVQDINPVGLRIQGGVVVPAIPTPKPGYMVAAGTSVICVADHSGRVAAIDRITGQTIWQLLCPLDLVDRLALGHETVALAGARFPGTEAQTGGVVVLDAITGEPRFPTIEDRQVPRWIGMVDEGLLLAVDSTRITAHQLFDGDVAWRINVGGRKLTDQCWAGSNLALMLSITGTELDSIGTMLVLDCATGRLVNRLSVLSFDRARPAHVEPIEQRWQITTGATALALGPAGRVLWRDAINAKQRKRLVGQLVGEEYVIVIGRTQASSTQSPPAQQPPAEPVPVLKRRSFDLYVIDRRNGILLAEYSMQAPLDTLDPDRGLFLENNLVFAAGDQTVIVPGATPKR